MSSVALVLCCALLLTFSCAPKRDTTFCLNLFVCYEIFSFSLKMAGNLVPDALSSIPCSNLTTELITFECTWTIEDIKQLCSEQFVEQPVLYSPTFIAPPDKITTVDKKPVEFQLRFDPKGNDNKDFVGVFLELKNHPGLDIMRIHSVVMANGEKRFVSSGIGKFDPTNGMVRGHSRKMRRSELLDPAKGFVSKDSLTLHCEVTIIVPEPNKPDLADQLQDKYAQQDQLTKSYGDLLESGDHSDVTFVLVDDRRRKLRAHKLILVAQSRVFADMFESKMKDSKTSRVEIVETREEVFKQMLKFIYTGKVERTSFDAIAKDLLICADKYQLDPLKSICDEHLVASITTESNLSDLLELANRHNAPKLKAKVVESLRKNIDAQLQDADKLAQTDRFLSSF